MSIDQIAVRTLVVLVGVSVFVLALNAVSQRVLGVRVGRIRAGLAAIVALGVELSFESQVIWPQPTLTFALVPLQIGVVFLAGIAFLVLAEFVVPTGSWPRPDRWPAALRTALARARRYGQISRIAARHRLLPVRRARRGARADAAADHRRRARSLRLALQEGGVAFVKLGQQLSTRSDLLPAEYIVELAHLQQDVPPVPWPQVEALLTEELGAPPQEVFAAFSPEPLAAASIGQAHRARLHDGSEVVVKIQRPGIHQVVERDLDIAIRFADTIASSTAWGRSLRIGELVAGFAEALREELDFGIEARNVGAVAAAMAHHDPAPEVVIPGLFPQLSTSRVLVIEFLRGHTLSDPESVRGRPAAQLERDARTLFSFLLRQVLIDGVFHADPHPGNLMVLDDGRLALIDFGSVGRIDTRLRAALQHVFLAVDRDDPQQLFDALFDLVIRPDELDEQGLHRALGRFMAQHLGFGAGLDMAMFTDLVRMVSSYGLAIPAEVATAFRAFATLEGTLNALTGSFDMVSQARSFAGTQLGARLQPSSLRTAVTDELMTVLPLLRRLPRHLDQISATLEDGRLRMNIRLLADQRDRDAVTGWLHLAVLTFLGGTTGIMATLLLANTAGPALTPTIGLFQLFGYLLVVLSAILVLRVLFDVFGVRRRG